MDVRLPDGTIIRNVPEGTTKAELVGKLKANGMAVPADWLGADTKPAPTDRQRLLSSAPMRIAKGMKDPVDGAAQLLQRMLPDGVVNAVNSAADAIGGEGTFLGDVLGIKGMTSQQMTQDIMGSNAEYEAARAATGQDGVDLARIGGNIVSPVNLTMGKMLPVGKAGETVKTLALKGAGAGAAGAATQPVMGEDFLGEKAGQVATGAIAGAILTPALTKGVESIAKAVRGWRSSGVTKTPEQVAYEIKASLARDDIDVGQIPESVMKKLTVEVNDALKHGKELDAPALLRKLDFERQGIKPTLGQLTRDPSQFTQERNMRGIQGVGEPLANRFNEQANAISGKFRQMTAGAQDQFNAGESLISTLKKRDEEMVAGVRQAYKAFKDSTGKDLDVPLTGLAQDYAKTLRDFGQTIPGSVRGQFEELGLLGGKQLKSLTIDDAENLIKVINKNYNPADRAQAAALDELRGAVHRAISDTADTGAGEAAKLAQAARAAAAKRFQTIDSTPALKAAINSAEPDDFVNKFVLRGKVREINALADLVGPEGRDTMKNQLLRHLESKAFGTNVAGDGAGSQAAFNRELQQIGRNKLVALLGEQTTDDLYSLGRTMAYIQQQPAGSAVNNSNTGAAVASLLGKVGGTIKGAPYINDFIVKPVQGFGERAAVKNALAGQLAATPAQLDEQTINALTRLLAPAPVSLGVASGMSVR